MDGVVAGFNAILDIQILLWISFGVLLGYIVGAMPGLGKGTAMAVAIPLAFYIKACRKKCASLYFLWAHGYSLAPLRASAGAALAPGRSCGLDTESDWMRHALVHWPRFPF